MGNKFVVYFAELQDINPWMNMIGIVKDEFPGLETTEQLNSYKQTVIKNINRKTALCIKSEDGIIGALIFSYNLRCLSWMAVHPNHRREGIASALVRKMLELFPTDVDISVTTFREGDTKGIAPRRLYNKFGFVEDALVEEFDYPNQILILKR
ncbi:GNAT family N-acetyltransferase [Clostridium cellulovorans]|uniref:GCN5-related N-acetyltransferase n=1 Tax=Clostridium cellulovorans (strain ATCC 35296 / DSM 3052 / OCM 3 / 743B) TaxID=573061 RepID=D9SNJ1_CLOC7|nr:GNAT family N-acetyltransferase [Clostridium cellulovorans]ADL53983.1 GCN5-related N-acetyltransferase [Clostridium cellulovorans 743B]